jgi:hypothetical protein
LDVFPAVGKGRTMRRTPVWRPRRIVGGLLGAVASLTDGLDPPGQSADESAVWAGAVN